MLSMVFKITLFRFFFLFRGGKTVKYPGSLQITKASNMVLNTKLKRGHDQPQQKVQSLTKTAPSLLAARSNSTIKTLLKMETSAPL